MTKNLSKEDLISMLSENLQISGDASTAALDTMVNQIKEYLSRHKEVTLSGFGSPISIRQKGSRSSTAGSGSLKTAPAIGKRPASEQRKLKRRNFILDIEIVNRASGEILGDLGDITSEGIMIVSDDPIAENTSFSIEVRLPDEADEVFSILFEANSIRCQETVHENIFITGFKITSIDDENKQKIETLIREYAV